MKIIDLYLAKTIIIGSVAVLFVLLGLDVFFALVSEFEDIGKGGYQYTDALVYILLTLPRRVYDLFPMAVLVGSLLSLGSLASNSELIVIRAAGVSIKRIVRSCVQAGLVMMLLVALLGEYVIPPSERYAQNMRMQKQGRQVAAMGESGVWVRNENRFINIRNVFPDLRLLNIAIYTLGDDKHLQSVLTAESAAYQEGQWYLRNVKTSTFSDQKVEVASQEQLMMMDFINPELFNIMNVDAVNMSAQNLSDYVNYLQQNKLDASTYQLAFWLKLISPVSIVAMLLLALPFVFGHLRSVNTSALLLTGILLGVGFFIVIRISSFFGQIYGVPPFISAAFPVMFFMIIGMLAVSRVR